MSGFDDSRSASGMLMYGTGALPGAEEGSAGRRQEISTPGVTKWVKLAGRQLTLVIEGPTDAAFSLILESSRIDPATRPAGRADHSSQPLARDAQDGMVLASYVVGGFTWGVAGVIWCRARFTEAPSRPVVVKIGGARLGEARGR